MDLKEPRYYLVDSSVLPEVFRKVVMAKRLIESGEAATVAAAAEVTGISRSAYYKYKDAVMPFVDMRAGRMVTFYIFLKDIPGVLSSVLSIFAASGVNILTINQSIPVNGCASVTITAETSDAKTEQSDFTDKLKSIDGVISAKVLAG